MADALLLLVALIWLAGTIVRIYRQARFYQIEEYMRARYLRWLGASRPRWLPGRLVAAWTVGAALSVVMGEVPGSVVPALIAVFSAIIAVWPPSQGEVKKG